MEELRELLDAYNDENTRADMTREDLDRLIELLRERTDEILDGEVDDDALAELEEIAESVESVQATVDERDEADEQRSTRAQDLADRIRGGSDDDDGDDESDADADGDDPEGADASDDDDAGSDDEGDDPQADDDGDDAGGDAGDDADADDTAEPIAASGRTAAPYRPRVTNLGARRPQTAVSRAMAGREQTPTMSLVASANVTGADVRAGEPLDDPRDIAEVFLSAYNGSQGYRGPRTRVSVARSGSRNPEDVFGPERTLGRDPIRNEELIQAITSPDAIVAAGGRCVPSEIRYDLPVIAGSEARPARDEMTTRFGADRGGVTTLTPPQLSDVGDDAFTVWTEANDQDPSDPATKPCLTVDCPAETETVVDALVKCVQFGNFRSRFFGEQVQAWLDLVAVHHAREAEQRLLTQIGTGSTQVDTGEGLSAIRDVLTNLDRLIASVRYRHRMTGAVPLVWGFPVWLYDLIRSDVARSIPGGDVDSNLSVADARIDTWFASRNVRPVPLLDGETGQDFGTQGDGPLVGWPDTVVTYLFPEGSWLFLDGGMLDLGIVRDSTLNSTNDFQMFAETFEQSHFHGVESHRVEMDLCPSGWTSAAVDFDPCTTGS